MRRYTGAIPVTSTKLNILPKRRKILKRYFERAGKIWCKRDSVIDCPFFLLLMTGAVACHFLLTAGGDCLFPTADSCCHFLLPITIGYCLFPCRLRFDRRGTVKADKPPARLRRVNFWALFARLMHHCRRLPTAAYAVQARQRTIQAPRTQRKSVCLTF